MLVLMAELCVAGELPMLQHRAAVTSGDKKDALPPVKPSQTPIQRPFIITRNDLQKQVLGLGYPSMPMYTVDEFYEQRVRDGIFPGPVSQGQGHQGHGHAHGGEGHSHGAEGVVESYESQRLREEREEDEKLMQQRAMDDFKDGQLSCSHCLPFLPRFVVFQVKELTYCVNVQITDVGGATWITKAEVFLHISLLQHRIENIVVLCHP